MNEKDTSIPQDLYDELNGALKRVSEFSKAKPLAGALLTLKLQVALQRIEHSAVNKAHDQDSISWARIGVVMGMRSPTAAWERYRGDPAKKANRRKKLISDAVVRHAVEDDNLITLSSAAPEQPPPKMEK